MPNTVQRAAGESDNAFRWRLAGQLELNRRKYGVAWVAELPTSPSCACHLPLDIEGNTIEISDKSGCAQCRYNERETS